MADKTEADIAGEKLDLITRTHRRRLDEADICVYAKEDGTFDLVKNRGGARKKALTRAQVDAEIAAYTTKARGMSPRVYQFTLADAQAAAEKASGRPAPVPAPAPEPPDGKA